MNQLQPQIEWRQVDGVRTPFLNNKKVSWAAQPGSQDLFLRCPVFECLIEGSRGGGKTEGLIMDFMQHVGRGYGAEWKGILFRQTYKQLEDVVSKTKKWVPQIFPDASFNESKLTWTWKTGEKLILSYMETPDDYWNYHGHAYPWIGWEELTTWPDDGCYKVMMSCSRSTKANMPRKYRSTTNPYGPGHHWVKARFGLPVASKNPIGQILQDEETGLERVAVHSDLRENLVLTEADPLYIKRISLAARNESERRAWLEGSWDIVAGGMIDDVWRPDIHIVPSFPFQVLPGRWRLDRSYDHGQSRPFSVGWWAESNGEPLVFRGKEYGGFRGDLFRIAEWYGWNGKPNEGVRMSAVEIAQGIKEREREMGIAGRVMNGPADASIFDDYDPGRSVARDMANYGVPWLKAAKGPGSRKQGWQQIRLWLQAAYTPQRESPALYICDRCSQFLRTVPSLPRDNRDLDDVDTDSEDHIGDEVRYRLRAKMAISLAGSWK